MFLRILIKEMKVRKSVNFILFLFIIIASVFLSSSVSNIVVVTSAIDYYMAYANTPDVMLLTTRTEEKEEIQEWLQEEAVSVENNDYEELVCIAESGIRILGEEKECVFSTEGAEVIAGTQENKYCKVYDLEGEPFTLQKGEIACGKNLMEQNGLEIGDEIAIQVGEVEKSFTICENTKDAVFGSPMSGMQRVLMHKEDFDSYVSQENVPLYGLHYVEAEDAKACVREIGDKEFDTISNMQTGENYKMIYSMDMIMAAVLIFMGLCFIFIAFLVLRFALVFTIEEDYREIGIMKAIGMREFAIKKIYLTKYLFLVVSGAVVGLFASIPVSAVMTDSVSQNMIMESSYANLWINVLCTILIIAVVMLFCYRCTKKLNKISAVEAIRGGQGSERFGKRKGIKLYKRNGMSMPLYLGINDIMSNIKRYLILLFTFCISFILITIPLNTLNTMRSREMVEKFDLNPESSIYVRELETGGETYKNIVDLENGLDKLQKALKEKGYDADITYSPMYFLRYGDDSGMSKVNLLSLQMIGADMEFMEYEEGVAPELENEIAFSKHVMKTYDWQIGDIVETVIGGEEKKMLITGMYTDYMQLGQSARLNPVLNCSDEVMFDYWNVMVDIETDKTQEEMKTEMEELFPEYEWSTAQELIDINVGGIQQTLDDMLYPMTGLLCVLIMLITILMEKLFIVREKGEIAMLKSIGYKTRDIRIWQSLRMVLVAFISMFVAVPLSLLSNRYVLTPVFAIMGAEVDIQVDALKVYVIFPAVLMAGIVLAAVYATRSIRKINIQEMNRAE